MRVSIHLPQGRWFLGLACAAAASLAFPTVASAQKKPRVVTISEVTIVGRVQKPIAAVDVSRIQPKLTLAELRQPFLDRIEKAVYNDPF
jgi:hypothetical protein